MAAELSDELVLAGTPPLMLELATVTLKTLLALKLGVDSACPRAHEAAAAATAAAINREFTGLDLLPVNNLIRMNSPPHRYQWPQNPRKLAGIRFRIYT
jgi:hypothetical protein